MPKRGERAGALRTDGRTAERGEQAACDRWSFVCFGLVMMASAAMFAQLEPTHRIPESAVQKADLA